MNRSESKYFNTARRMDEALLSLLEEKDFAYITVREICARRGREPLDLLSALRKHGPTCCGKPWR